jgi:hypothetical protein
MDDGFSLTDEEYHFLLDDIEQAIADANRKYGYGGYGFVDRFGNHYPDPRPRTVPESDLALERLERENRNLKAKAKSKSKSKPRPRPQIHYRIKGERNAYRRE